MFYLCGAFDQGVVVIWFAWSSSVHEAKKEIRISYMWVAMTKEIEDFRGLVQTSGTYTRYAFSTSKALSFVFRRVGREKEKGALAASLRSCEGCWSSLAPPCQHLPTCVRPAGAAEQIFVNTQVLISKLMKLYRAFTLHKVVTRSLKDRFNQIYHKSYTKYKLKDNKLRSRVSIMITLTNTSLGARNKPMLSTPTRIS
jgi:hypothetical protein